MFNVAPFVCLIFALFCDTMGERNLEFTTAATFQKSIHKSTLVAAPYVIEYFVPSLFALFAGAICDKYDKRKIMLVTFIIQACLLPLHIVGFQDVAHRYPLNLVLFLVAHSLAIFKYIAYESFVCEIVDEQHIATAMVFFMLPMAAGDLVGTLTASVLNVKFSVTFSLFVAFVCELIGIGSVCMLFVLKYKQLHHDQPHSEQAVEKKKEPLYRTIWNETVAVLTYLATHPFVIACCVARPMVSMSTSNMEVINPARASREFSDSMISTMATFKAVFCVTQLIPSLLIDTIVHVTSRLGIKFILLLGFVFMGVGHVIIGIATTRIMMYLGAAFIGIAIGVINPYSSTLVQITSDPSFIARSLSIDWGLTYFFCAVGLGGYSIMVDKTTIPLNVYSYFNLYFSYLAVIYIILWIVTFQLTKKYEVRTEEGDYKKTDGDEQQMVTLKPNAEEESETSGDKVGLLQQEQEMQ